MRMSSLKSFYIIFYIIDASLELGLLYSACLSFFHHHNLDMACFLFEGTFQLKTNIL